MASSSEGHLADQFNHLLNKIWIIFFNGVNGDLMGRFLEFQLQEDVLVNDLDKQISTRCWVS